jgi:hypothetical protein
MITVIAKNDVSSPPIIISILLFVNGVGNVVSGPIADALLASNGLKNAKFAYGIESYVSNPYFKKQGLSSDDFFCKCAGTTLSLDRRSFRTW